MWRVISPYLGLKGHSLGRLLLLAARWLTVIPVRRAAVPALAPFNTSYLIKLGRGFCDVPPTVGHSAVAAAGHIQFRKTAVKG